MNKHILLNAGVVAGSRMIAAAISFFLVPFMLIYLGTESFGLLSLAASFSAVSGFAMLLGFGLYPTLIVYVASYLAKDKRAALGQLISTALLLYSVIGLIGGVLLFGLSQWLVAKVFTVSADLLGAGRVVFQIMAVQVLFESIGTVPRGVLEGDEKYILTQGLLTITTLLRSLGIVIVILAGYGVVAVAIVRLVEAVLAYSLMANFMFRQFPGLSIRLKLFDKALLRELLNFSKPILGQQANDIIFRQAGRFIVGSFLSVSLVAHYDIVQKLFRLVMMTQSFASIIMPATSSASAKDDSDKIRDLFIRNTRYATSITSAAVLVTIILMPYLLLYWLGTEFVYLTGLTQIYVATVLGSAAVGVGRAMLTPLGRAKDAMIISFIGSFISFTGSLLTVNTWQLNGVIWSTVVALSIGWVFYFKVTIDELKLKFADWALPLLRVYTALIPGTAGLLIALRVRVPKNLLEVGIYATLTGGLLLISLFYIALAQDERGYVRYKIRRLRARVNAPKA